MIFTKFFVWQNSEVKNTNFPEGFIEKYSQILSKDELEKFLEYSNKPLRKSIRINTLKISVEEFKKLAKEKKWKLQEIPWCSEGFWINRDDHSIPLGKTIEHVLGLFFVQESSSMLPVEALFAGEGANQLALDMCAAPGAKTTQLAAQMNNKGLLIANEFSASRIKKLAFNLVRCGSLNTVLINKSGDFFGNNMGCQFDKILVDAPCTGEGTIRKDLKALDGWSEKKIKASSVIQKQLIASAYEALKAGGELVYSTCTLGVEENEEVISWLMEKYPDAELVDLSKLFKGAERIIPDLSQGLSTETHCNVSLQKKVLRVWPQIFDSEGFFVAKIRKNESCDIKFRKPKNTSDKYKPISKNYYFEVADFFRDQFSLEISKFRYRLFTKLSRFKVEKGKGSVELFLFPEGNEVLRDVHFDRAGILLCEIYQNDIRLSYEAAVCFGDNFSNERVLEISKEQAVKYFSGEDLDIADFSDVKIKKGQLLLKYDNYSIGFVKIVGTKLKNLLPRNFVQEVY